MAPLTAVGADGGVMVISIVAVFDDVVLPRLSATWNRNEPAVVLPLMGTKARSPAASSSAVTTWPSAVMATPSSSSVPSLGSEATAMLPSVSAATASEKPKSATFEDVSGVLGGGDGAVDRGRRRRRSDGDLHRRGVRRCCAAEAVGDLELERAGGGAAASGHEGQIAGGELVGSDDLAVRGDGNAVELQRAVARQRGDGDAAQRVGGNRIGEAEIRRPRRCKRCPRWR